MSEREEFWSSEEGITIRLQDLAHEFTFKTFNGALKGYFKESGIKKLRWITSKDNINKGVSCIICLRRNGKIYNTGQFLPYIPAHLGCDCYWDIGVAL